MTSTLGSRLVNLESNLLPPPLESPSLNPPVFDNEAVPIYMFLSNGCVFPNDDPIIDLFLLVEEELLCNC
jgi:hypothetical protein